MQRYHSLAHPPRLFWGAQNPPRFRDSLNSIEFLAIFCLAVTPERLQLRTGFDEFVLALKRRLSLFGHFVFCLRTLEAKSTCRPSLRTRVVLAPKERVSLTIDTPERKTSLLGPCIQH